jgi:hypothetical protein
MRRAGAAALTDVTPRAILQANGYPNTHEPAGCRVE